MKLSILTVTLALAVPTFAVAETRYGSFLHDDSLPNSLFLTGEINKATVSSCARRSANTRSGSSSWVRPAEISTKDCKWDRFCRTKIYLCRPVYCESSCANMFFGGFNRKADGQLGVHQFYSSDAERSAPLGVAEQSTQYTMADVIGIMNELDTPPFVYEKMLGTTEVHYFSEVKEQRSTSPEPEFLARQGWQQSYCRELKVLERLAESQGFRKHQVRPDPFNAAAPHRIAHRQVKQLTSLAGPLPKGVRGIDGRC